MKYCVSLALKALVLLILVCGPVLSDVDNRPIVIIREDDCCSSMRTHFVGLGGLNALTYAKQKHIPITWAVITSRASTNNPFSLTWAELQDYQSVAGGEFASHSCTHAAMTNIQSYIDEVVNSKAAIEAQIPGYHPTTFIQPGMWPNDADLNQFAKLDNPIGAAIQSTYLQSQAYLGGGWTIGPVYYKYGYGVSYTLDYGPTTTNAKSLALLDMVAQTPGLIYVVTFHNVQETGHTDAAYAVQADVFKNYMDKLAYLRDQGTIRLMSMNDAYHATLSTDLNLMADPGFELSQPSFGNDGSWVTNAYSYYKDSGGVGNSRYGVVTGWALNGQIPLSPGRYRISWSQRPEPGTPTNTYLAPGMVSYSPEGTRFDRFSYPNYRNTNPNVWERHSAVFKMEYGFAHGFIQIGLRGSGGYGVDDISVVAEPLDPSVSPSNSAVAVTPTTCDLSWDTPNDPTVTSICIRYDPNNHPETPTQGLAWGTVAAAPGTRQHLLVNNVSLISQSCVFFSIFAVKADGSYSLPELVDVRVDGVGPSTPAVSVITDPNRIVNAVWSSSDTAPMSGVYSFQEAVGSRPGVADVVPWTSTTSTSATVSVPMTSYATLFFSVKAQNLFGVWSPPGCSRFSLESQTVANAESVCDGSTVTVVGTVSAIFSDCIYVEDANRTRGIKIVGASTYHNGDSVTIAGVLSTSKGERVLTVSGQ